MSDPQPETQEQKIERLEERVAELEELLRLHDQLFEAAFDCGFHPKGTPEYAQALVDQGLIRARIKNALPEERAQSASSLIGGTDDEDER